MSSKEIFEYFHIYEFDINSNEDTTNLIKSMWEEIEKLNNIIDKQDKDITTLSKWKELHRASALAKEGIRLKVKLDLYKSVVDEIEKEVEKYVKEKYIKTSSSKTFTKYMELPIIIREILKKIKGSDL